MNEMSLVKHVEAAWNDHAAIAFELLDNSKFHGLDQSEIRAKEDAAQLAKGLILGAKMCLMQALLTIKEMELYTASTDSHNVRDPGLEIPPEGGP